MTGDVNNVVGASHDVEVAVLVSVAGVRGFIIPGKFVQIGFDEPVVSVPQRRQARRRQRQLDADRPDSAVFYPFIVRPQDVHVPARRRLGRRARLDRKFVQANAIGGNGPTGFRLPPVIDHRHADLFLGPVKRIGIGALAGQEQITEMRKIEILHQRTVRIFALDGAERRRRSEQDIDLVVADHPPERTGVGCPHRLAFVKNGGAAVKQRRVNDVGMADDPADIGRRPVYVTGIHPVDVLHRPLQGDKMPAIVADHALGLAGGARRVEDVKRVGRQNRHAIGRIRIGHGLGPVDVAAGCQFRLGFRALKDDAMLGLVRRDVDGAVQQRHVFDDPADLDPAGGRYHDLGLGVVNADRQFVRREPAEDHGMNRADARARQHGDGGFGYHRHVDDDPVALLHPGRLQHAGKLRNLVGKFPIGEFPDHSAGHG